MSKVWAVLLVPLALLALVLLGAAIEKISHKGVGWLADRSHDTPVWIEGEWMMGEYRDCEMLTSAPTQGATPPGVPRTDLPRLFCGQDSPQGHSFNAFLDDTTVQPAATSKFHVFSVLYRRCPLLRYSGGCLERGDALDRPDDVIVPWRCQRKAEWLECVRR
jgi:hypothetical protein